MWRPPALPGGPPGPGELDKGAQAPGNGAQAPGAIGLSRRWGLELATEGVRAKRIGNMPFTRAPSRVAREAAPVRREPIWSWSGEGDCTSGSPTHATEAAKAGPGAC